MTSSPQAPKLTNAQITDLMQQYHELLNKSEGNWDTHDTARNIWGDIRWADLIVPAPAAISVFGQLTLVGATVGNDFDLDMPTIGGRKQFEYIRNASFRATVQQLRMTGLEAFGKSRDDFHSLSGHCENLKDAVDKVMDLLWEQNMTTMSPKERLDQTIRSLPALLKGMTTSSEACSAVIDATHARFSDLFHLAAEMNTQVTSTNGTVDRQRKATALKMDLTKQLKDNAASLEEMRKQYKTKSEEDLNKAQRQYDSALDAMPTVGQLVAYQMGQKAFDTLNMGAHVFIQSKLTSKQFALGAADDLAHKALSKDSSGPESPSKPDVPPSQPPSDSLAQARVAELQDPIYQNAEHLSSVLLTFRTIVTGFGGSVDWDEVKMEDDKNKGGLAYVKKELDALSKEKYGQSQRAKEGRDIIDGSLKLASEIEGYKDKRMDPRVEKIISEVKELAAQAQTLSSAVIHNSGQPTIQNPNMLRPPQIQAPQMGDDNASALSGGLYAAQVKVTTSQQQLQSAQVLYKQAVDDLQKITTDLAQFTEELKALSDEKIDWDKIHNILVKTVVLLGTLVVHIEHLRGFFHVISDSVDIKMKRAFETFRNTAEGVLEDRKLGNFSLNEKCRKDLMDECVMALKIEYVINRIAKVYINLYDNHISPGMNLLSDIPPFIDEHDEAGKTNMGLKATEVKEWAAKTQKDMLDVMKKELEGFEAEMKTREAEFKEHWKPILETIPSDIKGAAEAVTKQYVEQKVAITEAVSSRRQRYTD